MIKVTQKEVEYLRSKGFDFPDMLHRTYSNSGNNRYYATTDRKLMAALDKYRKSRIVLTVE